MKLGRILLVFSAVILWIGLQSADAQELTISITPSDEEYSNADEFWTPERLSEVEPLPWYEGEGEESQEFKEEEEEQMGAAGSVPGGLPGNERKDQSSYELEEGFSYELEEGFLVEADSSDFVDFGTQDVYDDGNVHKKKKLQKQYPWRAIGKLVFTTPGGSSASCTASLISPNNIIVTAAHCVYDRGAGKWMNNWRFYPAYRKGGAPYGSFAWTSARVLTAWINSGGRKNDVAVISLAGDPVSATGWLGRSWNYGIVQHHHSFGYPGNIGKGEFLIQCTSETYRNCGDGKVFATGCSMTYGSSGGPWIRKFEHFRSGAMNYVNSVVSGYDGTCTGTFGQSYNGARFTGQNIVPLCNDEGC